MALWCKFSQIFDFGMFRSVILKEYSCVAPLTPAMMVIRGLILHPLFCKVSISGSYLLCYCMRAWSGNLL